MSIDEFYKYIRSQIVTNYIVWLKYKYNHETEYTESNEIFLCEIADDIHYIWLNDWYEGQEDIIVLGCIPIEAVRIPKNLIKR